MATRTSKKNVKNEPAGEAENVNETEMPVTNQNGHAPEQMAELTAGAEAKVADEPKEAESESKPKAGRKAKAADPDELEPEVGFAPKTFLIPYVLLMLRDSFLHGYAIWEKLMLLNIPGLDESDRATIYRTLRQLEREGKVKSEWDTTTNGPARRVYTLTDAGESFLQIWAVGLDQYRQNLDFFFKMYTGGRLPSPFGFNFNNPKRGNNSQGGKDNV